MNADTSAEDLFAHAAASAPTSAAAADNLRAKSEELLAALDEVEELETALKAAKAVAHRISTQDLPELMDSLGTSEFTLSGMDRRVRVERIVSGSLPKEDKDKRERALARLRELDGAALIKSQVTVTFRATQDNEARSLAAQLAEAGHTVALSADVHPQTLAAFGRELLDKGAPVDLAELGLFVGRKAKVVELKPSKVRR